MKSYILLLIPFFIACEEAVSISEYDFTIINYSFNDAALAPEYHRSYVIDVTPSEVTVTVDSYGDTLAEAQFPLATADLNNLLNAINQAELRSGDSGPSEGCDGGWSESLSIENAEGQIYSGYFDHCGGNAIPASLGDIEAVVEAMEALIPNLSDLVE
ncbi:MAG: hypothetical protein GQ574_12270 [Crocinitomix sp.]|nr:hypothetical protein [Crocinitomix sp.]